MGVGVVLLVRQNPFCLPCWILHPKVQGAPRALEWLLADLTWVTVLQVWPWELRLPAPSPSRESSPIKTGSCFNWKPLLPFPSAAGCGPVTGRSLQGLTQTATHAIDRNNQLLLLQLDLFRDWCHLGKEIFSSGQYNACLDKRLSAGNQEQCGFSGAQKHVPLGTPQSRTYLTQGEGQQHITFPWDSQSSLGGNLRENCLVRHKLGITFQKSTHLGKMDWQ